MGIGLRYPISNAYVFCFLTGGLLRDWEEVNHVPKKQYFWAGILLSGIAVCMISYGSHMCGMQWGSQLLGDTSIPLLVLAASISGLCLFNEDGKAASPKLLLVSTNSFGVYIYHMFWLNLLYKVVKLNPYQGGLLWMMLCIVLITVVTVAVSVISTMITKKIPVLKELI